MTLAPAIDDPSMLPTCENCHSIEIGMTSGTDVILCTSCSIAAQKILAGWKGWPPKPKKRLPAKAATTYSPKATPTPDGPKEVLRLDPTSPKKLRL